MRAADCTTSASHLPTPITTQVDVSPLYAANVSIPEMGQPLQSESVMTEEEERELTDFLGTFADTLPPSIEGDEGEGATESDLMPDTYHVNYE